MKKQKRSIWRWAWLWILVLVVLLAGAAAFVAYGLPYGQWKYALWRMQRLHDASLKLVQECPETDASCLEHQRSAGKRMNADFEEVWKLESPMLDVLRQPDLIEAMKHPDGTICYEVDAPLRDVTDDELHLWLKRFGVKRFEEMAPLYLKARRIFEERYHGSHPLDVKIAAIDKLKWHAVPLSTKWRLYNTAALMLGWSRALEDPTKQTPVPEESLAEILPLLRQQGEYFTTPNFFRLLDMAKAELHPNEVVRGAPAN
jgi:hypothetical protein